MSARKVEHITPKLEEFKLVEHFAVVFGGTHDKREGLIAACKTLGVQPEQALFVGDLASDVRDGNAAGLTTVLLAPHDYPYAAQAHHHITDLKQLIRILDF